MPPRYPLGRNNRCQGRGYDANHDKKGRAEGQKRNRQAASAAAEAIWRWHGDITTPLRKHRDLGGRIQHIQATASAAGWFGKCVGAKSMSTSRIQEERGQSSKSSIIASPPPPLRE